MKKMFIKKSLFLLATFTLCVNMSVYPTATNENITPDTSTMQEQSGYLKKSLLLLKEGTFTISQLFFTSSALLALAYYLFQDAFPNADEGSFWWYITRIIGNRPVKIKVSTKDANGTSVTYERTANGTGLGLFGLVENNKTELAMLLVALSVLAKSESAHTFLQNVKQKTGLLL
ncbi:MAG: hypothetical protein WBQ73_00615 [Candidatus Babeliales bacterium]